MLYFHETLILSSNMRGYLNLQVPMGIYSFLRNVQKKKDNINTNN